MLESLQLQGTIGIFSAQANGPGLAENTQCAPQALRTRREGFRGPRPVRRASMLRCITTHVGGVQLRWARPRARLASPARKDSPA